MKITKLKTLLLGFSLLPSLVFASPSFETRCETTKKFEYDPNPQYRINILDWIKTEALDLGFKNVLQQESYLAVQIGERTVSVAVEGSVESCAVVGGMLTVLKKYKERGVDQKINGMTFIFSRQPAVGDLSREFKRVNKSKVFIKEFVIGDEDVARIPDMSREWFLLDQNPTKVFGSVLTDFVKSFDHTEVPLKKIVNGEEVKKFEGGLKDIIESSKKWSAEKFLEFQAKLSKNNPSRKLKEKMADLDKLVELYDEVRKGLWDRAQKTQSQLNTVTDKLKTEFAKGKQNTDIILKIIRQDIVALEQDIKSSFDENKKFVFEQTKDSSSSSGSGK